MGAALPFVLGQQGAPRRSGKNRYVVNEDTRDEALDADTKYPLHRLSREATRQSETAMYVLQEKARVRRLFPNSGAR